MDLNAMKCGNDLFKKVDLLCFSSLIFAGVGEELGIYNGQIFLIPGLLKSGTLGISGWKINWHCRV